MQINSWDQVWQAEQSLLSKEPTHEVIFQQIALLNQKQLEQINVWDNEEIASIFIKIFDYLVGIDQKSLTLQEKTQQFTFLMQLFARPEVEKVQINCLKFLSQAILINCNNLYLKHHFLKYPQMISGYIEVTKIKGIRQSKEANFIHHIVQDFLENILKYPIQHIELEIIPDKDDLQNRLRNLLHISEPKYVEDDREFKLLYRKVSHEQLIYLKYIEKFVDLMILLLSSISTRKFLKLYLLSQNLLPLLKTSIMQHHSCVLSTLVELFDHYLSYPLNDLTGEQMSVDNQTMVHKDFLKNLQAAIYKKFQFVLQPRELEEFTFVKDLSTEEVKDLFNCVSLPFPHQIPQSLYAPGMGFNNQLMEVLREASQQPVLQNALLQTAIIPNEDMIWDYKRIPEESSFGILKQTLALPKLNLQFLSFDDYLDRNYWLFKLQSAFDLRKDLEDAVIRMAPVIDKKGRFTHFEGWARMSVEIKKFKIHDVAQPLIGKRQPKSVVAEVQYTVDKMSQQIKREWDALKRHDVIFLVSFNTKELELEFIERMNEDSKLVQEIEENQSCKLFCEKFGIRAIRGAEVSLQFDERRKEVQDWEVKDINIKYQGFIRILNVNLDPVQYQDDLESGVNAEGEIYGNFKIIIRRKPKENNFKAVLHSIENIIDQKPELPPFLSEILLGYGVQDKSSSYRQMILNPLGENFNLYDTFLDQQHFKESFMENPDIPQALKDKTKFQVQESKKLNIVRFTQPQVTALTSSLYQGINVVIGPPGTGKTDLAVQIVNLLYKNFKQEKTLVITHSNYALNDIFEKISYLDIDEKHLLRLGIGEKDLKLTKEFSKSGRINHMLAYRIQLLELVGRLQDSLNIKFTEAFTCEIAEIFFRIHIDPLFRNFQTQKIKEFPFKMFVTQETNFFSEVKSDDESSQFQKIKELFQSVSDCRAFEILRNKKERGNFIVGQQARIIAMTCTHAALKRSAFLQQDLKFENVIIEEAGQILEIEAFLPLTMTKNLKRVILIGDHNQLPPVIKNVSFQKIANMEQSFFIRMIRLGVHAHTLQHQGRARVDLVQLFKWKYPSLQTLKTCLPDGKNEFSFANPGFSKLHQFIDVDYQGLGESRPAPYIFQNVVEAEFVVAVYMYMVLTGYDPNKITILTTYNGQKLLIRDIIQRKCAWHSLFKTPSKVTTVDKFQGQQNDYILLSMVRTDYVGYLRDVRRIIVALSRARLGLYIFGKFSLFASIPESRCSFNQFQKEGLKLFLNEDYPTTRRFDDQGKQNKEVNNPEDMYNLVKSLLGAKQIQ